jgi:nitrate reductase molybdenum cofactor assembly chaperone
MNTTDRLDGLAAALAYPGEEAATALDRCRRALAGEALRHFERYHEATASLPVERQQEEYTRTFDLDAACSLEVGWHLFGENYSRGEFLVSMRRALRENGLRETGELPDHLVHVLPVLARLESAKASMLATVSILPALAKMLEALEGRGGRYEDLLKAVQAVVREISVAAPKEVARG